MKCEGVLILYCVMNEVWSLLYREYMLSHSQVYYVIYCYSAGCFCPNGTVRHNGECISIDDCPKSMLL